MINTEKLLKLIEGNSNLSEEQISVILDENLDDVKNAIASLKNEGVIKGYKTLINWEKTSVATATALIEVKVTPQRDTGFDEIAMRIASLDEVQSVYLMSGGYDLAVTVTAPSMNEVAMFVMKRLATIEGVKSTATHFILTKYKDQHTILYSGVGEKDERGIDIF